MRLAQGMPKYEFMRECEYERKCEGGDFVTETFSEIPVFFPYTFPIL